MLSAENMKIEYAVPHNCSKGTNESNQCAHCHVGYEFIVTEPESLKSFDNISSDDPLVVELKTKYKKAFTVFDGIFK